MEAGSLDPAGRHARHHVRPDIIRHRHAPPPPVGTGRITGTVVDHESGRPVRFAIVSIAGEQFHRSMITDGSGVFSFDQLAAGAYRVIVNKPGYLETEYGQARPGTD